MAGRLSTIEAIRFDGIAHHIRMNVEFAGNGADFPVLGVKVTANLDARFRADHEFLLPHREYRGKGSTNRPFRQNNANAARHLPFDGADEGDLVITGAAWLGASALVCVIVHDFDHKPLFLDVRPFEERLPL